MSRWLDDVTQDLRYAARSLARTPAFALTAIAILALGIGSTTAVFSAARTVLLDPRDDRLVVLYLQNSVTNRWTLSTADLRGIEQQQRSFTAVGGSRGGIVGVAAVGEPQRLRVGRVTSGFLRALGVRMAAGRSIEPSDEPFGAPPVVVLGYPYAVRTFATPAAAIGKTVTIDGLPHTVVGILPPDVQELAGNRADLWPVLQLRPPTRRGPFGMYVVARLAPGVTIEMARREMSVIGDRIYEQWASGFHDRTARLVPIPYREARLSQTERMLELFGVAVALVLLIAVANVASLMLVRATGRWREMSLRSVLGASRMRLVRLLVTEGIVIAGTGAAVGLVVGAAGLRILIAVGPNMPRLGEAHLDLGAVGFAVAVAILAGAVVSAYPVAVLFRRSEADGIRDGARTTGAGRRTHAIRGAFVAAEFALALPLLAGAGLLINSFVHLQRVQPGFDPTRLLTARVALPAGRYADDAAIAGYWARALPLVREIPGVVAAGLGSSMIPNNNGATNNFDLVDHPVPRGTAEPASPWQSADADYFGVLGVPLLEGRNFMPSDSANAPPVVIVSRSWAKHYFPEGNVVGRRLVSGGCTSCPLTTVVGVVGDVKHEGLDGTSDAVYGPLTQGWSRDLTLVLETRASPAEATARVRAALQSVDAGVPVGDIAPMEDRLAQSIAQPRNWTTLLTGYAAAAVLLAAIGIFGMLSYTVSARRREIGVRMALGAQERTVVGMIVRGGMGYACIGAAIGVLLALAGTRFLAGALFEVRATDPITLGAVTAALLGVALLSCWLPARRAAMIDPVEAIRTE